MIALSHICKALMTKHTELPISRPSPDSDFLNSRRRYKGLRPDSRYRTLSNCQKDDILHQMAVRRFQTQCEFGNFVALSAKVEALTTLPWRDAMSAVSCRKNGQCRMIRT